MISRGSNWRGANWRRPLWRRLASRWLGDRFGVRLGLILTLALAPVGLIALLQSFWIGDEVRARTEAALAGETLHAAAPKLLRLADAQGMSAGLAQTLPGMEPEACAALLRGLAGEDHPYRFAAYYDAAGHAICASSALLPSVEGTVIFDPATGEPVRGFHSLATLPAGEPSLLLALTPVATVDGQPGGFVAVAPHQRRMLQADSNNPRGFLVMLFDREGDILSASAPFADVAGALPRDRTLREMFARPDGMFSVASITGDTRRYSLNTVIPDQIYALGTWPQRVLREPSFMGLPNLFLPAVTWAACLIAAWATAELMVTRHMRRFRQAITAFTRGDRAAYALRLDSAPREIRQAAEAFGVMTETILKDEAELEDSLRQREALLREVHHRVKNNLQLMASIINLQLRRTRSDEAKAIMRRLQGRMLSLATIHNSLFHTASLTEVAVRPIFAGIVDQITLGNAGAGQRLEIEAEFAEVSLSPEQVVPLALWMTESVSLASKLAARGEDVPRIGVTLRREPADMLVMEVTHAIPDQPDCDEADRDDEALGNQLIHAFALQLTGTTRRDQIGLTEVQRVEFRIKPPGALPQSVLPAVGTPQG